MLRKSYSLGAFLPEVPMDARILNVGSENERFRSAVNVDIRPGWDVDAQADAHHLPFRADSFDLVICSAVLHFAENQAHFDEMVADLWRVLAPGGLFFARLASNIGLEHVVGAAGLQVRLPDGTDRFLVDEAMLLRCTEQFGGRLADPIKTTNVQQQRCMTTWCAVKGT
jgi:SAM-dependent methyltransferase